ncbi:hypothetical protein FOXB_14518, partial [Fusarium oxysporum f. sp. conglutinans Fo5176]
AYQSNGQIKKAVELLEHIVTIRETTLAENHPNRLALQHALAGAYRSNGQIKEAVELLEYVVAIEAEILAEDDHSRQLSKDVLQACYESLFVKIPQAQYDPTVIKHEGYFSPTSMVQATASRKRKARMSASDRIFMLEG